MAALLAALLAPMGCRGPRQEPLITYYNPEHAITMLYPASWKTEQTQQDGVWYRYFLAPPVGVERKPAVSVTLIAGPLGTSLDAYAQTYLSGNTIDTTREETRQGARGRYWLVRSSDGKRRQSLLLLEEPAASRAGVVAPSPRPSAAATAAATPEPEPASWVYGLYAQGDAEAFAGQLAILEKMAGSLTLERPAAYVEERNDTFAFALRVPPSWRSSRNFSGSGTYLKQFTSPAFGAEKDQTIHASLTLTVEPVGGDGSVDVYYSSTLKKLGEAYTVLSHQPWHGGYVDVFHSETPVAVTRSKRFFRTVHGRGYMLAFEARDDIYPRMSRWSDMIASSLKIGPEVTQP